MRQLTFPKPTIAHLPCKRGTRGRSRQARALCGAGTWPVLRRWRRAARASTQAIIEVPEEAGERSRLGFARRTHFGAHQSRQRV